VEEKPCPAIPDHLSKKQVVGKNVFSLTH